MYTSNKPGTVPCACTTVKKLSRILVKSYDVALASSGINITQLAVLRCISRREGEPLSHVADELEMDRTSLYRAIAPMERANWLSLTEGKDARSKSATILAAGKTVLKKANTGWSETQTRTLSRFGEREWLALVSELERLADCVQQ